MYQLYAQFFLCETPEDVNTDSDTFDFIKDRCYSKKYASLKEELIKRASYDHLNFKEDNGMLFKLLDKALQGTTYHSTLQPYIVTEDGQAVALPLFNQYGGKTQWEAAYKSMQGNLLARKWKSPGCVTINDHAAYHQEMYTNMAKAAP